jgi:glutaredoxin
MSEMWTAAGLALEYCAYMIAIMVERCGNDLFKKDLQFSPAEIAAILNSLPCGSNQDFNVDAVALHQGVHHFKRFLTSRGFTVIEMYSEEDKIKEYYELGSNTKKGYHLKFPQIIVYQERRSMNEIANDVVISRDTIFKMYKIKKSLYLKSSYIFMEMHENDKKMQLEKKENYTSPALVVHKFRARKNVETVSEKTKKKNAKRILEMIDEAVGEDNVTMYLDFVNKLNNKRLKLQNRTGNENEMNNNEKNNDIQLFTNAQMIANDFSVKEIITSTFTSQSTKLLISPK